MNQKKSMDKIDYHLHCHASFDSQAPIEDMVERAIENNFSEICFTDHWDIMIQNPSTQIFDYEARDRELTEIAEKYRDIIQIRKGMELGQPYKNPEQTAAIMKIAAEGLDYVIGSIHNLFGDEDLAFCNFREHNLKELYDMYIDQLILMAREYDFDMLGHITYPSRYMFEKQQICYDMTSHMEHLEELFYELVKRGKGIEVNTSGYFRGLGTTMPDPDIIRLYRQCKGELITIGSDSHAPQNLGVGFAYGLQNIQEAGFSFYVSYQNRKPVFHKIG